MPGEGEPVALAHPGCNKWVTPQTSCDTNACLLLYFLLEFAAKQRPVGLVSNTFLGNCSAVSRGIFLVG